MGGPSHLFNICGSEKLAVKRWLDLCVASYIRTMNRKNISTKKKVVLLVDDDTLVREAISKLLGASGYSVLQAENGQEALAVLKKTPREQCMILLDLAMPVMDGREFLERRASDPMLCRIPVVVVSGNPPFGEPLKGVHGYLQKPVRSDRLIEAIEHPY
jgi:CheY-like chemotaxis protein